MHWSVALLISGDCGVSRPTLPPTPKRETNAAGASTLCIDPAIRQAIRSSARRENTFTESQTTKTKGSSPMKLFSWLGNRPTTRARRTHSRSPGLRGKPSRTRRLAVETLESRTLMSASPGSLDSAFGPGAPTNGSGYATTAFPIPYSQLGSNKVEIVNGNSWDSGPTATAVAVEGDGKIIAAGNQAYTLTSNPGDVLDASFVVARYNTNGTPDTAFGSGGVVETTFFPINSKHPYEGNGSWATSVLVESVNGVSKILVTGYVQNSTSKGALEFYVAQERLNMDGSLDTSFGGGTGEALIAVPAWGGTANAVLQSNGQVVVATGHNSFIAGNQYGELLRINQNGTLDTTFGPASDKGIVPLSPLLPPTKQDLPTVVQPDDKIVVGGRVVVSVNGVNTNEIALVRYTKNGTLDPTFGSGGILTTLPPNSTGNVVSALTLETINNSVMLVVGGSATPNAFISRFDTGIRPDGTPDGVTPGALDTTFGTSGWTYFTAGAPWSMVLAPDGDIIAGDGSLLAFTPSGNLDPNFGSGGVASQYPFAGTGLQALAIASDGDILAVGQINGLFGIASYVPPM